MFETIATIGIFGFIIIAIGILNYRQGKMEAKIDFIYNNIKVCLTFINNNKK